MAIRHKYSLKVSIYVFQTFGGYETRTARAKFDTLRFSGHGTEVRVWFVETNARN